MLITLPAIKPNHTEPDLLKQDTLAAVASDQFALEHMPEEPDQPIAHEQDIARTDAHERFGIAEAR